MKPPFFLLAVLTAFNLPAQSQILNIFQQSADQLREYVEQIAALDLLLARQQEGYKHVESNLAAISTITGNEFTLHQNYYSSLPAVNPAISQSPELDEFVSFRSLISADLTGALDRWNKSESLTANDHLYIAHLSVNITQRFLSQSLMFRTLTTDDAVALTDDQRTERLSALLTEVRSLYAYTQAFVDQVDLLILNRKN